ncbi:hypothetical protein [Leptospira santarosai]|uniref:Uncharacterized protein n=1 Tax=Leptospira santarosai serovar Shermani str. LT 821 TaxID=758847 RepID=K8Y5U0_9LEPT|nr:hypothetical protein [Leptospira santarosai]EKT88341.1 hypothetical protein LSS_03084 [Leptospira santarosai serovar Shermani str. LT 821]
MKKERLTIPQRQRCAYIAEKVFRAKKKLVARTYLVGKEEFEYDWVFPDGRIIDSKTNFEFLPEWVGPICEVVLPMIGDMGWSIFPLRDGLIFIFELTDSDEPKIIIPNRPFVTALIDACIKISGE